MPRPKSDPDSSSGKTSILRGLFSSPWKVGVLWIGGVFLVAAGILAWNSPLVQDLFAGPKIPLPRQVGDLSLGTPQDQILQKYPEVKNALRPYNDDPLFKIATLQVENKVPSSLASKREKKKASPGIVSEKAMPVLGASTVDLLFFQGKLYYLSATWEGDPAKAVPAAQWVEDFRRWNPRRTSPTEVQSMGDQVLLKEWRYADGKTEMTLRDLNYPDHI